MTSKNIRLVTFLQLNGVNKLLVYADDVVLLGDNEEILRANTHTIE